MPGIVVLIFTFLSSHSSLVFSSLSMIKGPTAPPLLCIYSFWIDFKRLSFVFLNELQLYVNFMYNMFHS